MGIAAAGYTGRGGVPEWLKGAVLKTAKRREAFRGFESHPRRFFEHSWRG
jgi:hypothetical protein